MPLCHRDVDSFPVPGPAADIDGDINKRDFKILFNDVCPDREGLDDSVIHYHPND